MAPEPTAWPKLILMVDLGWKVEFGVEAWMYDVEMYRGWFETSKAAQREDLV